MGCWNGTCGISQMPIHNNDPIMVMFIAKNPYPSGGADFCYSHGKWEMISVPFEAQYNDYGSFENPITNKFSEKSFGIFRSTIVEKSKIDSFKLKNNINRTDITLSSISEYISNNMLELHTELPPPAASTTPIGMFMVHKRIYDAASTYYSESIKKTMIKRRSDYLERINDNTAKKLPCFKIESIGYNWDGNFWHLKETFEQFLTSTDSSIPDEIFTELSKLKSFTYFMDSVRRAFQPQQGLGSQTDGFEEHSLLFKLSKDIINDYKSYLNEDNDDDEDYDENDDHN